MSLTKSRNDQNWVFDNFLKLSENEDTLHPGVLAQRLERGYKYSDLQQVYSRITGRRSYSKSWAKQGHKLELMARSAISSTTKAEFYHRAAMCYGRAQHTIKGIRHPKKIEYYGQLKICWAHFEQHFEKARTIRGNGYSALVMEHDPHVPYVVIVPGMDQFKEEVLFPYNNPWYNRGFNVVVIEGPGHVSQMMDENYIKIDNMSEAIDTMIKGLGVPGRSKQVVLFGMSFGTRWVIEAAAKNSSVVACIGQMSNVGNTEIIFNQAQPNFRRIFMEMANIHDEKKFDKYCNAIDKQLIARAKKIKMPYLLVGGEMDELCPPEQAISFVKENFPHGDVWMYEDCFHVMGEVCSDIYGQIADWAQLVVSNKWQHRGIEWRVP